MVPQVAIKVWDVDSRYGVEPFAAGVSDDAKTFASSLTQPYCGVNSGFEAVNWLDDTAMALSLALMPLRAGSANGTGPAFGMLVLASPDPQRFQSGMGTDFLERIAELASAALSRLRGQMIHAATPPGRARRGGQPPPVWRATPLVERYLEHVRVEKRLAARTVELYALDLRKLADNAAQAGVELTQVQNAHIRRWVAQMHGAGRSGRGIALILSGWRGFYVWLGRQGW